jgi:hypothetical protein
VEAVQEAVQIRRRQLAKDRSNEDLAISLHNLANYLRNMQRSEEAVDIGLHAIDLRRQLVKDQPNKFKRYLRTLSTTSLST